MQLIHVPVTRVSQNQRHSREEHENTQDVDKPAPHSPPQAIVQQSYSLEANDAWLKQLQVAAISLPPFSVLEAPNPPGTTAVSSATGLTPQELNATVFSIKAASETEPSAQNPLVLGAEVGMSQQRDSLSQEVPEVSLQEYVPQLSCSLLKSIPSRNELNFSHRDSR